MAALSQADRPVRLTYVITDLELGGVPLHLHRLATRLPRRRFLIEVISLSGKGPVGEMLASKGIPVFACRARSPRDVRALWRLWRLLAASHPDVVHSLLFHANIACRAVGPMAGIPAKRLLCEIQTAEVERRWHLVLDNLTCRLCRCEVGNSPSVVDHLHRQAHLPKSRLACQWGAVDVAAIDEAKPAQRSDAGLPADEPVVLWTGRLDPVKGFEEMLAGFAILCRSRPARLLLVGEGPSRPAIERLIAVHGLGDRVRLLGRRTDVPSLLKMADVFLFCSRTEGLPNSLLEAMAAGLPVITTDVPGCRDVVADGVTGLLASPRSPEDVGRQLTRLLGDAVLADRLGREARSWVRQHLDIEGWAARWQEFYVNIARGDGITVTM